MLLDAGNLISAMLGNPQSFQGLLCHLGFPPPFHAVMVPSWRLSECQDIEGYGDLVIGHQDNILQDLCWRLRGLLYPHWTLAVSHSLWSWLHSNHQT